jgi:SAM-dependent methyltransferase
MRWLGRGGAKRDSQASADRLTIQTEVGPAAAAELLARVEQCWQLLGTTAPHWSVLTAPQYEPSRIGETAGEFYATGRGDLELLKAAAERCGVTLPVSGSCFELGCGVGRITLWLARTFRHVIATDISASHLALAAEAVRQADLYNVELRQVNRLQSLDQLPSFDCFFSLIVLQHNPPPVMRLLLATILSRLAVGGIGFFQLPTELGNYGFDVASYLGRPPTPEQMETHALPHDVVLATLTRSGCELLEAREHDCVGTPGSLSMTFLVRKVSAPA